MARGVLLVGGGKMGGALLAGWLGRGALAAEEAVVAEPDARTAEALCERHGVLALPDRTALPADFDPEVVVFAVKPQVMDAVLAGYRPMVAPGRVFLSIAAGKTLGYLERRLGVAAAVVRAMPNTPAAVGRGMTVACANARVDPAQAAACTRLLEAVGEVAWIEDERHMDAVTAVSGSGPAYVFLLVECLAKAGSAAGLPAALAEQLARTTVCGAGELAWRSTEPIEALRGAVTSPGGTTAAALEVLMAQGGLAALMDRAVAAAAARSRELAGD